MQTAWAAPTAQAPVRATVTVPGSKSITNRALLLAAAAAGRSTLRGALRSRDTELMIGALRGLGVAVEGEQGELTVRPPERLAGPATVDCGLAGTVMRFVPPLASLADGSIGFDGDAYARTRPLSPMLDALRGLGADIDGDALPFTIAATGALAGGAVTIDASASSQFVSGLLLAAPRFDDGVVVRHRGEPVPSLPHVDLTVSMLREAGAEVDDREPDTWLVRPGTLRARDWVVEPDLSNAAVFLAAAAATGGRVSVPGWPTRTAQAGDGFRPILERMGAEVTHADGGLHVTGPRELAGVDADLHRIGELAPTVAALAALATTPSTLRGIAHLRGHETDRIAALAAEIRGLGGVVTELPDGLRIEPAPLHGGAWHAYADHRMATAGAIIGLAVAGVDVDEIDSTSKTLPEFPALWRGMFS